MGESRERGRGEGRGGEGRKRKEAGAGGAAKKRGENNNKDARGRQGQGRGKRERMHSPHRRRDAVSVPACVLYELRTCFGLGTAVAACAARVLTQMPTSSVRLNGVRGSRLSVYLVGGPRSPFAGVDPGSLLPALLAFPGAAHVCGPNDLVVVDTRAVYSAVLDQACAPGADPWAVRSAALRLLDRMWVALAGLRFVAVPGEQVRDRAAVELYLLPALRQRAAVRGAQDILCAVAERRRCFAPTCDFDWAQEADDEDTDARLVAIATTGPSPNPNPNPNPGQPAWRFGTRDGSGTPTSRWVSSVARQQNRRRPRRSRRSPSVRWSYSELPDICAKATNAADMGLPHV